MKDDDIKQLFARLAEHFKDADDNTHRMFSMLVKTTLKHRDELLKKTGVSLTIGETQKALEIFMEVLKTRKIPPKLDKNVHDLVILWLEELKTHLYH